jgi:hypothetical protein
VSKAAEEIVDDPDAKKFFKFTGDCGMGVAQGGAWGAAAEGAGALLGASEVVGLGSNAANSAARRAAKEYFVVDGVKIFAGTERARKIAAAMHGVKVASDMETAISLLIDAGFAYCEAREHAEHVRNGYDYKS